MTANDIQFTHRSYHCIIVHCLKRTIESHKIKIIINHTIMKLYLSFLISLAITSYANANCLLSCTLKTEDKISFNKCYFKCIGYERGAGFPDWDGAKDDDKGPNEPKPPASEIDFVANEVPNYACSTYGQVCNYLRSCCDGLSCEWTLTSLRTKFCI